MANKRKHSFLGRSCLIILLLGATCAAAGYFTRDRWLPKFEQLTGIELDADHDHDHGAQEQGGHGHEHPAPEATHTHDGEPCTGHHEEFEPGHDAETTLDLSEQAQKNLGLKIVKVARQDFDRTTRVPGMVAERSGRTRVNVSAPMTGVVTRIYPISGEAVLPGQPLFDLRMIHEDLVSAQSEFLKTIEELDVIEREVARLEKVTEKGIIAGKALLERQYEQQKTEAMLRAQRQALILHGLSEKQVDEIASGRKLLQQLTIFAPKPPEASKQGGKQYLQVAELAVAQGQHVDTGDTLCVLTDHAKLYIEGKAFEEDAKILQGIVDRGDTLKAVVSGGSDKREISNLKILYVESEIERDTRALRFYVELPNELVRNESGPDDRRFVAWRYKPGQRVELLLPVERWKDRIVVPVDAVAEDGPNRYVFERKGDHFHREPVHVEYRDRDWIVLGSDSIETGAELVVGGAHLMHREMEKKAAGGGEDAHAGHVH